MASGVRAAKLMPTSQGRGEGRAPAGPSTMSSTMSSTKGVDNVKSCGFRKYIPKNLTLSTRLSTAFVGDFVDGLGGGQGGEMGGGIAVEAQIKQKRRGSFTRMDNRFQ